MTSLDNSPWTLDRDLLFECGMHTDRLYKHTKFLNLKPLMFVCDVQYLEFIAFDPRCAKV